MRGAAGTTGALSSWSDKFNSAERRSSSSVCGAFRTVAACPIGAWASRRFLQQQYTSQHTPHEIMDRIQSPITKGARYGGNVTSQLTKFVHTVEVSALVTESMAIKPMPALAHAAGNEMLKDEFGTMRSLTLHDMDVVTRVMWTS